MRAIAPLPARRIACIAAMVFTQSALMGSPGGYVHAAEIAGVRVAPDARVADVDLVLNGAGLRRLFRANVYVIGLYFPQRTNSAESAFNGAGPKRIALTFMREVTAQSLVDALFEGVRDNSSEAEFAKLKASADTLSAIMLPLKVAKKGDIVALDYLPNTGAQVVMNGRVIGKPVPGHDLYRALLRIWLGDSPVDANLKRELLGQG